MGVETGAYNGGGGHLLNLKQHISTLAK